MGGQSHTRSVKISETGHHRLVVRVERMMDGRRVRRDLSIAKLAPPETLKFIIDKLLGLGSLVFLASAALSFVSIRLPAPADRLKALAESVFLAGLALLSLVTS